MSRFLSGAVAGAIVSTGFYYGFSNLISSRSKQHTADLHYLSVRIHETPTLPPPSAGSAASRIQHNTFTSVLHSQWNEQLANAYTWFCQAGGWATNIAPDSTSHKKSS